MGLIIFVNVLLRTVTKDKLWLVPLLLATLCLPSCAIDGNLPTFSLSFVDKSGGTVSAQWQPKLPEQGGKNPIGKDKNPLLP